MFRLKVLPISLALPWGLNVGDMLGHLPAAGEDHDPGAAADRPPRALRRRPRPRRGLRRHDRRDAGHAHRAPGRAPPARDRLSAMRVEEQIDVEAPPRGGLGADRRPGRTSRASCRRSRASSPRSGGREPGIGARYRMRMHVGSADVGGLIEVVEYDEGRDIAWTSITGIDQRGRWRLREASERRHAGNPSAQLRLAGRGGGSGDRQAVGPAGARATCAAGLETSESGTWREKRVARSRAREWWARLTHELGSAEDPARGRASSGRSAPTSWSRMAPRCVRWGRSPAAGFIAGAQPSPERARRDRRARHAHLRARSTAAPTRSRTALADAGVKEGDGVAIMCRNHRGFVEATVARREARRPRALPEHRLRRARSSPRSCKREKPVAIVLRPGVHRPARGRRHPAQALHRLDDDRGRRGRPHARGADRGLAHRAAGAAGGDRQGDHPHLGHHRHAEGRQPRRRPTSLDPAVVAPVEDPAAARARSARSPRRCSTRGASRTSPSGCCSAPRWCSRASSTPRPALRADRPARRPTRWWWCR